MRIPLWSTTSRRSTAYHTETSTRQYTQLTAIVSNECIFPCSVRFGIPKSPNFLPNLLWSYSCCYYIYFPLLFGLTHLVKLGVTHLVVVVRGTSTFSYPFSRWILVAYELYPAQMKNTIPATMRLVIVIIALCSTVIFMLL